MEIKRIINGEEIKIALTEQELNEAYREQKRIFDMNEVRDELSNWGLGEILNCCAFPYPSHHYLRDEEIEEAEKALMDKEELMLDIYMEFSRYQEEGHSDYETNMYDACTNVLEMFRDEHWDYLKSYETIDVIAYKKYREDWIKRQNFSDTFMEEVQEDYALFKAECYPNSAYTFHEYLDNYGFLGTSYVCINEFLVAEYHDVVYMNALLTDEEYNQYLEDVSEFVWCDIVSIHGKVFAEKFPISGEMDDEHYQIDAFLDAVSKKYGIEPENVKTYMMDNIHFAPKELPFGAEACGCYKNGELQYL